MEAVRNGTANDHQRHLVNRAASQAGGFGNDARKARDDAAKGNPGKWGKHRLV